MNYDPTTVILCTNSGTNTTFRSNIGQPPYYNNNGELVSTYNCTGIPFPNRAIFMGWGANFQQAAPGSPYFYRLNFRDSATNNPKIVNNIKLYIGLGGNVDFITKNFNNDSDVITITTNGGVPTLSTCVGCGTVINSNTITMTSTAPGLFYTNDGYAYAVINVNTISGFSELTLSSTISNYLPENGGGIKLALCKDSTIFPSPTPSPTTPLCLNCDLPSAQVGIPVYGGTFNFEGQSVTTSYGGNPSGTYLPLFYYHVNVVQGNSFSTEHYGYICNTIIRAVNTIMLGGWTEGFIFRLNFTSGINEIILPMKHFGTFINNYYTITTNGSNTKLKICEGCNVERNPNNDNQLKINGGAIIKVSADTPFTQLTISRPDDAQSSLRVWLCGSAPQIPPSPSPSSPVCCPTVLNFPAPVWPYDPSTEEMNYDSTTKIACTNTGTAVLRNDVGQPPYYNNGQVVGTYNCTGIQFPNDAIQIGILGNGAGSPYSYRLNFKDTLTNNPKIVNNIKLYIGLGGSVTNRTDTFNNDSDVITFTTNGGVPSLSTCVGCGTTINSNRITMKSIASGTFRYNNGYAYVVIDISTPSGFSELLLSSTIGSAIYSDGGGIKLAICSNSTVLPRPNESPEVTPSVTPILKSADIVRCVNEYYIPLDQTSTPTSYNFEVNNLFINGIQYKNEIPLLTVITPDDLVNVINVDGETYSTNVSDWLNAAFATSPSLSKFNFHFYDNLRTVDYPVDIDYILSIQMTVNNNTPVNYILMPGKSTISDEFITEDLLEFDCTFLPSPTPSVTETPFVTPSISVIPSTSVIVTPSVSATPSISVTPSASVIVTPSVSATPSISVTPSASVLPILPLTLRFDDIVNADALVGNSSDVNDWNTFFELPTNGTPFTSVEVVDDEVKLFGGDNIILKDYIFEDTNILIEISDGGRVITDAGDGAFANNLESLTTVDLPGLITAGASCFSGNEKLETVNLPRLTKANNNCFNGCTSLITIDLPELLSAEHTCFNGCTSLITIDLPSLSTAEFDCFTNCSSLIEVDLPNLILAGDNCFSQCISLVTINLPLCIDLGDTVEDDNVFSGINGNTITATFNSVLETNNSENPDGDVQYLDANNTVTITYV
jgi:ribosomal protein L32